MGLEMIRLREVSQTEKDKYHMISLIRNLKKMIQMNLLQNRNRVTDLENELMVMGWGEGGAG